MENELNQSLSESAKKFLLLIKQKQELQDVPNNVCVKLIQKKYDIQSFLASLPTQLSDAEWKRLARSAEYKTVLKESRKILHDVYGVFRTNGLRKRRQSHRSTNNSSIIDPEEYMQAHQSTSERLEHYNQFYQFICDNIPLEKLSVVDVASGLNPLSIKKIPTSVSSYIATDISSDDLSIIQDYFTQENISGETHILNLFDVIDTKKAPDWFNGDVCFLLKTLDSLEALERNCTNALLNTLPTSYAVVTFPCVSIGGKKAIKTTTRGWFDDLEIVKKSLVAKKIIVNELVYVLNLNQTI